MLPVAAIADWRRFSGDEFRIYHKLAICQGAVAVLAGFDVVIPWALAIGLPPFVAVLLGMIPLAGGMAQIAVPRLLDRTDGNLRDVTVLCAAIAEPRGLYLAALAIAVAAGLVSGPLLVVLLVLLLGAASVAASMTGANLLSWHSAVLADHDRRLVVPRLMAVSLGVGGLLLLPVAALLDSLVDLIGLYAYALPFLVSGAMGVAEVFVVRRLRHPGRVIVPPAAVAADAQPTVELDRFLRVSMMNALGMGIAPAMSVYAIAVVGLTAGFTMMVAAIATLTMVAAAAIAGSRLGRGSSAQMLRRSFAIRALAMASPLLALPGTFSAPLFLIASAMLGAIGFAGGSLAANERLYRLISGPAVIRQHARYLARTSGAMTAGQVVGATVIGIGGPLGYPAFALLYAASTAMRVAAFRASTAARPVSSVAPAPAEAQVSITA